MVFSSVLFLFQYLPLTLLAYYLTPLRWRNLTLLVLNLLFYGWGEPVYIVIMFASIAIDYTHGLLVERCKARDNDRGARMAVASSVIFNLALLGFFKYWDFIAGSLQSIGVTFMPVLGVHLPIGISFYTFQTMSYTIDVYRGDARAQRNILNFGTFVTLFPQLIAGPIIKYKDLGDQIDQRTCSSEKFASGVQIFMVGLAKKLLIANNVGMLWDSYKAMAPAELTVAGAWLGVLAFTFQIYFDFSGYSDMAVGLGRMLGFEFLPNFNYPYISRSVVEFWKRWHISLTNWFREYVYFPLGGSRKGTVRTCVNLMVVFLVSGLWHGAEWSFVVWGALNGLYQVVGSLTAPFRVRLETCLGLDPDGWLRRWWKRLVTFALVDFAWLFFRANSFLTGVGMLRQAAVNPGLSALRDPLAMITVENLGMGRKDFAVLLLALVVLAAVDTLRQRVDLKAVLDRRNIVVRYAVYYVIIFTVLIFGIYGPEFDAASFIYFQF